MSAPRTPQQQHDRPASLAVDHAASYLRERLNRGQFGGLDGAYAGYSMCALLDALAVAVRNGELPDRVRSSLLLLTQDLAAEEQSAPTAG